MAREVGNKSIIFWSIWKLCKKKNTWIIACGDIILFANNAINRNTSPLRTENFARMSTRKWKVYPGGGALDFHLDGGGVPLGSKTWPCLKPLGAQKIHPVTIYLTKIFICIPCTSTDGLSILCCVSSYIHKNLLRPARTVAGAEIAGLS